MCKVMLSFVMGSVLQKGEGKKEHACMWFSQNVTFFFITLFFSVRVIFFFSNVCCLSFSLPHSLTHSLPPCGRDLSFYHFFVRVVVVPGAGRFGMVPCHMCVCVCVCVCLCKRRSTDMEHLGRSERSHTGGGVILHLFFWRCDRMYVHDARLESVVCFVCLFFVVSCVSFVVCGCLCLSVWVCFKVEGWVLGWVGLVWVHSSGCLYKNHFLRGWVVVWPAGAGE